MFKFLKSRAFVSLNVFLSFTTILITSILMFINKYTTLVVTLHTIIGFTLLIFAFWHLKNNFSALRQYLKWRTKSVSPRFNIALPAAFIVSLLLVSFSLAQFSPFVSFIDWGSKLRARGKVAETIEFSYVRVDNTPSNALGTKLKIDLRTGPYFMWPQYAIWLETLEGEFIQPLYITKKLAKNMFSNKVTKVDADHVFTSNPYTSGQSKYDFFEYKWEPESADQRARPESLPVFLHKLASQTQDRPDGGHKEIDGYTGATMLNSFLLSSRTEKRMPDRFKVRFEINQSFDYNDFYSSDRFPNDPVYSGDGYSAQPSVVYEATVDNFSAQEYYPMTLVGHGHHSGQDGQLYTNMEGLTTATALVDRIIVEFGDREKRGL